MDFALSANMKWYNREVSKLCLQKLDLKKNQCETTNSQDYPIRKFRKLAQ